jgi:hypothetical protein
LRVQLSCSRGAMRLPQLDFLPFAVSIAAPSSVWEGVLQ